MRTLFMLMFVIILLGSACGPLHEGAQSFKEYTLFLSSRSSEPFAAPSMTFNLSCTQTFGGSGTFTQNSIVISGTSGTIQVLKNTACTLTVASFNDGNSSYTPVSSSLVISITSGGVVSWSGTLTNPPSYVNNASAKVYLFLVSGTVSSLSFEYTYDPQVQSVTYVGP